MHRLRRFRTEQEMTLIELMVVILIIEILAAIALPAFLAQRAKAQDGNAKSDARSMVSAMEACYTEVDRYDPCPDADVGIPEGPGPGEVDVTSSGDTYVGVANSHAGNTFTAAKNADNTPSRTCTDSGTPEGGCAGGAW